jgi:hypothetical protein
MVGVYADWSCLTRGNPRPFNIERIAGIGVVHSVAAIWDDRLAEVWATPGNAGTGVVVGAAAVLTARQVVAGALYGGNILSRVVRPGATVAAWVPMTVLAEDPDWDVALLGVDQSGGDDHESKPEWSAPSSPPPVFVRLGISVERGCEAVGFPQSAVQQAPDGYPVSTTRQTEQVIGTLLPAGQTTPPANPAHPLPKRWLPFDVDSATPDQWVGWDGMAGAGVILSDGRLVGLVVNAEGGSQRRLYVVTLSDVLAQSSAIATALPLAFGGPFIIQDRYTPDLSAISSSTYATIQRAASLAGGGSVDASMLFLAALQHSRETALPGVTSALLASLVTSQSPTGKDESADQFLERLSRVLQVARGVSPELDVAAIGAITARPPLSQVLILATEVAEKVSSSPHIHLRHLIAATVLASDPPLRPDLLAELHVSATQLREILVQAARADTSGEPIEAWQTLLLETAAAPISSYLAGGVSTDLVDPTRGIPLNQDNLDVGVWVSMLAAVIADAATPMPLSVGIFGEWGTGKSYFMGLLRSEVEHLSGSTREPYLPHVVQIGFNAWHYADTNLWASLGDEIFRQLAGPSETADESRRRLREELAKGSTERQVLEARTAQARQETVRLKADLEKAVAHREVRAKDLISAIKESPELQGELDKAWKRLGIRDEVQQARILADEVRGTAAEASATRRLLGQQRIWVSAGVCVIALLVVVAAAWVPANWGNWLGGGGAAAVALALASVATWLGRANEGLARLRTIAADLNRRAVSSAERRTSEAVSGAVDKLRRAEADENVAQAQLDEMSSRVKQLARELSELMPGQRLYAFLAERAVSGQYASQLSLISTIRKDFQYLVELLRDWRVEGSEGSSPRPIDRIVLYIDDLDRCRPKQVVDVLQAVHLLLALDLFVVVVGVDPRWLRRSLQHQYQGMLDAEVLQESTDQALWDVTPNDYLEKIFNIPFVLPGIPTGALSRLLRGLAIPADLGGQSALTEGGQSQQAQFDTRSGDRVSTVPTAASALAIEPHSELAASQTEDVGEPPRPLTEPELTLLSALEPFIGTPREAKRMFNLYRMLRSTRDLSDASAFLGNNHAPGEYQAVALLLGMLTSDARILRTVLDAEPQTEPVVSGGLTYRPDSDHWHDFIADFAPVRSDETWTNQIIGPISPEDVPAWQRFSVSSVEVSSLISPSDLTAFKRWAPRIRRFSFLLSPLNAVSQSPRGPTDHNDVGSQNNA